MLESLHLKHVGPAPGLTIDFRQRMNFLAGDNGLGKSFLLDVAWWALTRTWARELVIPHRGRDIEPEIQYQYTAITGPHSYTSKFNRENESWSVKQGRPPIPGLVLYAHVDGGFSVWDPARNYWHKTNELNRPASYVFAVQEVWKGLEVQGRSLCEGLIRDWANWQRENGTTFQQLVAVLTRLSPSATEPLRPGNLTRISAVEGIDHPTIRMSYGQEVALVHASAGIRRVVALAYLLVWAWTEHLKACELIGSTPAREIVFLIDEIEAHLHPQWQRRIVPALLEVMNALTGEHPANIQLIAATHSPLILASTEAIFNPEKDAIWELDLGPSGVSLTESPWIRHGDANRWLTSSVFDLREARSVEAEEAIRAALDLLRKKSPNIGAAQKIDTKLRAALGDIDPFWIRWSDYFAGLQKQT